MNFFFGTEHRKSHVILWRNSIATLVHYCKSPLMAQPWNKAKVLTAGKALPCPETSGLTFKLLDSNYA